MKQLHVAALAALLACAGPALADHKGKHKNKGHEPVAAEFSGEDADAIRGYYRANPQARKQLPPGLAKKDKLPPGWQKKLARGERVPDEVWAQRVPVPREIRLGDTPVGVINVRIDDRIVRVAEKTRQVLDILNLPSEIPRSGPPR